MFLSWALIYNPNFDFLQPFEAYKELLENKKFTSGQKPYLVVKKHTSVHKPGDSLYFEEKKPISAVKPVENSF